jgi:hypothetical protein
MQMPSGARKISVQDSTPLQNKKSLQSSSSVQQPAMTTSDDKKKQAIKADFNFFIAIPSFLL